MMKFLESIGMVGVIVFFAALLIGVIVLLKNILNKRTEELIKQHRADDVLTKKHYSVDLTKYSGLMTNIGLALSLGFILTAFEFPTFDNQVIKDLGTLDSKPEETLEIPPTEQLPPPPPKIQQPEIVEVPDEEEIEDNIELDLNFEANEETVVEEIAVKAPAEEKEEEVDEIFEIVEEGAEPVGGYEAFYKYISKNIKYPNQAKRMGVEGKVYVQFVVDKSGQITEAKAIRGIGAGCDEEAVRVVGEAPKWKPGKQRGRAVKQRIVLPINFKLG
jgi:periplasmic protein TonB